MNPTSVDVDLDAYFERIGYSGTRASTLDVLRAVQDAHVRSIPFENLDPLTGKIVRLDLKSLQDKLIGQRRGGYCHEHNTLLRRVLERLGFRVSALAARVRWQVPTEVVTALGHMALRVELNGASYLVDAGFGGWSLTAPLDLAVSRAQQTTLELCRLTRAGDTYFLEAQIGDAWSPIYQFDLRDHPPNDFEVFNWYACTSPQSRFVSSLMAASVDGRRRHALLNGRHTVRELGAPAVVRQLGSAHELRRVLEEQMGLCVPRHPALDSKLESLVGH